MSSATNQAAPPLPQQDEMPFALVQGQPITELPADLYIPPDALEVILEAFEGPLDLLLYLIRKQNIDILNIPIAEITQQYVEYVDLMHDFRLELAAEYLLMAAILAEIKSRLLLPKPRFEEEEEDPRADLIRRLQEYERFKNAAENIDALPRIGRDFSIASAHVNERNIKTVDPEISLQEVLLALKDVMKRASLFDHHHIKKEQLSVRERMTLVMSRLSHEHFTEFTELFAANEGKTGIVVTFLALLELIKEHLVELVQNELFGKIHIKLVESCDAESI